MKCIRYFTNGDVVRVSNDAAHKAFREGKAEYVPKHIMKEAKARAARLQEQQELQPKKVEKPRIKRKRQRGKRSKP